MRVLIIHTYYKLPGGEDSVVENEAELLRSNGHIVDLLPFHNASKTLLKVFFLFFNPAAYQRVIGKIKSFTPDVIHIHNFHFAASPAILYAAKRLKVPVVMTMHNFRLLCPSGSLFFNGQLFTDSLKQNFPWSAVKKGVYQGSKAITFWLALSNYLHRKMGTWSIVNAMIFLGEHSRTVFKQSGVTSTRTALLIKPNFTMRKSLREPATGEYFLYVGRLTEEKGIKTLLKAFEGQHALLKIAGTGPLHHLVTETTARNSNIEYLGQLPPPEVARLMRSAKALVFPSEWFETFGMVIIEAFSLGTPVVAANLGNVPSIVSDKVNGLLFEPSDAVSLRKAITTFDELNADEKLKLKNQALEAYEKSFSPEANLQQLVKIYSDTMSV
ncbi:glycosyltransferase [Pedobacter endophyticus]|uniref:Glycosyltransferase n=1 Tax=Pedobacter endophyticus TaxID=2789740 RepID=A0A7S9L2I5_9SPHI|nr:glycosyltransferase [Pedobacter endophyticus]QPH41295.1 glycosyltransferase [Pedobacter endophyticus]